jgi:hypothetical protein
MVDAAHHNHAASFGFDCTAGRHRNSAIYLPAFLMGKSSGNKLFAKTDSLWLFYSFTAILWVLTRGNLFWGLSHLIWVK